MARLTRLPAAVAGLIGACAVIMLAAGAVGAKSSGKPDQGTAYVAVTHSVGSTLYAAGDTMDKVLGPGAVTYTIKAGTGAKTGTISVGGSVTVFTSTGSLSGTIKGTETTAANGSVALTGTLKLKHGTGGQTGHSYVGTFTGTGTTATGPFVFHTKATYQ